MDVGSIPNSNLWVVSLALPACECLGEAKIHSKIGYTARVWVIIWTQVETMRAIYKNREPALGDFCYLVIQISHGYRCCSQWDERGHARKDPEPNFFKRSQHRKIFSSGLHFPNQRVVLDCWSFLRFEMYTTGTHVSWSQFVTLDLACGNPP